MLASNGKFLIIILIATQTTNFFISKIIYIQEQEILEYSRNDRNVRNVTNKHDTWPRAILNKLAIPMDGMYRT